MSRTPLACAAALAVRETIETDNLVGRSRVIGKTMIEGLTELQRKDRRIGDVRGRGAMIAVELGEPGSTDPSQGLARRVAAAAHERG